VEVRSPLGARIGRPKPGEDFRHAVQKTYAPTWYPGVDRVEDALPVRLAGGAPVEGVDIKIAKRRTAAIRGHVFSETEGQVDLSLTHVKRGFDSAEFQVIAEGPVETGSAFEIDGVSPGSYYLLGEMKGRNGADRRWAVMPLEIGEDNQDNLDLNLREAVSISGQIRIKGRETRPDEPVLPADGVLVELSRVLGMGIDGDPGVAPVEKRDGSFRIEGVIDRARTDRK
jgi:hypothetical protein